ncbi:MAG TPA: ATP-binding protein [Vicinamibacteria bacterium]|nr:ATP-binding protein [Vicinamibacteria bacterium]
MSRREPDLLRVGILGLGPQLGDWVSGLAGRNLEVVTVDNVRSLLASDVELAVVFAAPGDAAEMAVVIASEPKAPPTAMIFGPSGQQHPHIRFIRNLLDAKNEWERTFDAIVDPVALLDRSGAVRRANLGLARALGLTMPQVLDRPYSELLGAPAADQPDPIAASLADGAARTEETSYARLPGVQQVTVSPHRDGSGTLHELVVILKDVNVFKEQQARLRQSARLADIGQLAAGVAHEINTPLASIALRAESLLRSARDERLLAVDAFKNFPRYLQTIDEEIFRCKKIIGALLEFSRARPPEKRPTDLNLLAEKAAELVGHQMKLKQISLSLRLQPQLAPLHADDGQLRQVLIALLMNALDATPAGGHVEIETRHEGNGAVLTVADDGAGIPPEHLGKIFSPFFTTKPVGQGTGLGLAICHGIVASHGGEIRVDSGVGRGTRISLALPTGGTSGLAAPKGGP